MELLLTTEVEVKGRDALIICSSDMKLVVAREVNFREPVCHAPFWGPCVPLHCHVDCHSIEIYP